MIIFLERWMRLGLLIVLGTAIIVLPRFLPDISIAGLADSDKFGIQLLCFVAVTAVISLDLLNAAIQATRAVLRGEVSRLSYTIGAALVVIVLALFVREIWHSASMILETVTTIYVLAVGYLIAQGITGVMRWFQPRTDVPPQS